MYLVYYTVESEMNVAQTVRILVQKGEKILLLQKDKDSKLPDIYEFPGGKVDVDKFTISETDRVATVLKELFEEAHIATNTMPEFCNCSYEYCFQYGGQTFYRRVYFYKVRVPADTEITVNLTLDHQSTSEDHHSTFRWVSKEEYCEMKRSGLISPNSIVSDL